MGHGHLFGCATPARDFLWLTTDSGGHVMYHPAMQPEGPSGCGYFAIEPSKGMGGGRGVILERGAKKGAWWRIEGILAFGVSYHPYAFEADKWYAEGWSVVPVSRPPRPPPHAVRRTLTHFHRRSPLHHHATYFSN